MTRIVPGQAASPTRANVFNLQHTDQERTQFMSSFSNGLSTFQPFSILCEKLRIVMHHSRARPRRADNRIDLAVFVDTNKPLGYFARFLPVTSIERGLRTTCLPIVKLNFATNPS
jgi:hypothetical protein